MIKLLSSVDFPYVYGGECICKVSGSSNGIKMDMDIQGDKDCLDKCSSMCTGLWWKSLLSSAVSRILFVSTAVILVRNGVKYGPDAVGVVQKIFKKD